MKGTMEQLRRWCVAVGLWLVRLGGQETLTVPRAVLELLPPARLACATIEVAVDPATSGEYKRAQVYAMLIKRYPTARRRHIALAIELALGTD